MLDFATKRRYIVENPPAEVKHFNELRERPTRRMLTLEEEGRILDAAPVYLRVAIILLAQTGGRTYSEGFSLRWSQVDFEGKLIRLDNNVKTPGSAEPIPLSEYACDVLRAWKKETGSTSEYVFPSPVLPNRPISTVKTVWKTTLKRAGVPAFPIYNLRHVFCTVSVKLHRMLLCSAPCATPARKPNVTTSWEWPTRFATQWIMRTEGCNGKPAALHFRDSRTRKSEEVKIAVCN